MLSEAVVDHLKTPRNQGVLEPPCASGLAGCTERGQFVRVQLRIEKDRIQAARFQTYGCAFAIAAASYLTEWATGRTCTQARRLEAGALERALGGFPPAKKVCAAWAVEALRAALDQVPEEETPDDR